MLEQYLEEKRVEFEQILFNKDWVQINPFQRQIEEDGYGQYVPEISEFMSEEDVIEYKQWDKETNGSTIVQTDDNS